jgi:ABC-type uncharacterized transport system substrate-binding protein
VKRREFITLVGGAAAWPLAARAQQPGKLPTIGYLGASTPLFDSQRVAAFVQRLRELGWIEGRTVAIDYRWSEGRTDRYTEIAAEFVRLKVDVIVATGGAIPAAKQATSVIPIVFPVAGDPVGGRYVDSLARPGGNVTGLSLQQARWAGADAAEIRRHTAELAELAPDVIVAHGSGTLRAVLQATRTVPIVFPVAADPVGSRRQKTGQLVCSRHVRVFAGYSQLLPHCGRAMIGGQKLG